MSSKCVCGFTQFEPWQWYVCTVPPRASIKKLGHAGWRVLVNDRRIIPIAWKQSHEIRWCKKKRIIIFIWKNTFWLGRSYSISDWSHRSTKITQRTGGSKVRADRILDRYFLWRHLALASARQEKCEYIRASNVGTSGLLEAFPIGGTLRMHKSISQLDPCYIIFYWECPMFLNRKTHVIKYGAKRVK